MSRGGGALDVSEVLIRAADGVKPQVPLHRQRLVEPVVREGPVVEPVQPALSNESEDKAPITITEWEGVDDAENGHIG